MTIEIKAVFKKLTKYSIFFLFYPTLLHGIVLHQTIEQTGSFPKIIFIFPFLIYAVAVFFTIKKLRFIYLLLAYFIVFLLAFFESAYLFIYQEGISSSTAYVLLETNIFEAGDYLQQYFNQKIVFLLLVYLVPSVIILIGVFKTVKRYSFSELIMDFTNDFKFLPFQRLIRYPKLQNPFIQKTIFLSFTAILGLVYVKTNSYKKNAVYQLSEGYLNFTQDLRNYEELFMHVNESKFLKSVEPKKDKTTETLIIVIGEATNRSHMSLYGYYRNTTPYLTMLKDELIAFSDVISPHTQTALSLEKVMTFGSTELPENKKLGSIVQLVKEAGYKTFWISNQPPIGVHETLVTKIARASDYLYFTNLGSDYDRAIHDEQLLPSIHKSIEDEAPKKVIFVHLMGCHLAYSNRYPKSYDYFRDKPQTNYKNKKTFDIINQYDNALRYNDFVLNQIISDLKNNKSTNKRVLFLADHGEEIHQSMDFLGHTESVGSYPMFEIPFILWSNQKDEILGYKTIADRKYMADNFIYSVADLLKINFEGMDETKSIFSPKYIPPKRIVLDKTDYDLKINPLRHQNFR
jgi:heptose-I-phosphate ethanolaminephosphotransferase